MDLIQNTAKDVQTTVTSLGAAFAGVAAERGSAYIIRALGGRAIGTSMGAVGLNFIARAAVSSVAFAAASSLMPETSDNVFFTILFFACNPSLVGDARTLANIVVDSAIGIPGMRKTGPSSAPSPGNGPQPGAACSSGGCGY